MENGLQIGVEVIKTIVWQQILKRCKFEKTPFHSSLCENRFQFESVQKKIWKTYWVLKEIIIIIYYNLK